MKRHHENFVHMQTEMRQTTRAKQPTFSAIPLCSPISRTSIPRDVFEIPECMPAELPKCLQAARHSVSSSRASHTQRCTPLTWRIWSNEDSDLLVLKWEQRYRTSVKFQVMLRLLVFWPYFQQHDPRVLGSQTTPRGTRNWKQETAI